MPKIYLDKNVYEASLERISEVFDRFERVYVSFSAGKDSTVMLHMVVDEAIRRGRKIGVLFIDLEGQYRMTINHARDCFHMYREHIDIYWVCLPIHLRNAVSVFEPFWRCWDKTAEKSWIRPMPIEAINDEGYFDFFFSGMEFEEFVPLFGEWFSQGKKTACFVGIRTDESLNRFRALSNTKKEIEKDFLWTTKVTENVYNIYPLYDWKTEDIWAYHGKNKDKPYNRLYDLMYKAGLTIHQSRICQPYGDDQRRGLWLFHLIEPETWSKVVARVNGANSGSKFVRMTGSVSGYRNVSKPEGHTWKSFSELIINSLPPHTARHYKNKILVFVKWWMDRGYPDGIPDEPPHQLDKLKKVPSWKRICKTLLRNDYWCKGLGFSQTKSDAYHKYLKMMEKRKEKWQIELF